MPIVEIERTVTDSERDDVKTETRCLVRLSVDLRRHRIEWAELAYDGHDPTKTPVDADCEVTRTLPVGVALVLCGRDEEQVFTLASQDFDAAEAAERAAE